MPSSWADAERENTRLIGIGLMCAAVTSFAFLDATGKYIVSVAALPVLQVAWFRFFSHAVFNVVAFGPRPVFRAFRSTRPWLQIFRGILLFSTTALNFAALRYLQLDMIATVFFLSPFLVAILAGPILGEWIGWRRMVAIMIGFSGVLLIVRPGFGGVHWAIIYSFGATTIYAAYAVITRYLARHDSTIVTQIHTPLAGTILLFPLAAYFWTWPSDVLTWVLLFMTGTIGGFGHYLLILAHKNTPAPILAPFTYIGLFFQTTLGYLVFSDVPSIWTLAGGAVIISSGLYLLYRERTVGPRSKSKMAENETSLRPPTI
jgi:drug/metabolite transporter (DMT)-like permease